jgi:aminopeptidase
MDRMQRLAELAVTFGANVQPGQILRIGGAVGHQELARMVAHVAYRHGARFVGLDLDDPLVHRSRVMHAPADTLAYRPEWPEARIRELDDRHGASVKIVGPTAPGLLDDLDPRRRARSR